MFIGPHPARRLTGPLGLVRYRVHAVFVVAAAALLVSDRHVVVLPEQPGFDWMWYLDGPARFLGGLPLYDSRMLQGPYNYVDADVAFKWNQAPWLVLPLIPIAALPDPIDRWLWLGLTNAALVTGLWLVWPRRIWRITGLALIGLVAVSPGVIMGVTWGNLQGLTVLGVALWWRGRQHGLPVVAAMGIVLAGAKVIPALPLIVWSLVRDRDWRPIVVAGAITAALTLPVVMALGVGVFDDFATAIANQMQLVNASNLSPALLLRPYLSEATALALIRALAVVASVRVLLGVKRDEYAFALLLSLSCVLVTNLYATWTLLPLVGALVAVNGRSSERAALEVSS